MGNQIAEYQENELVEWHRVAMMYHYQATGALGDRHFGECQQAGVKLWNHLCRIPFTVPPGYKLVKIDDDAEAIESKQFILIAAK